MNVKIRTWTSSDLSQHDTNEVSIVADKVTRHLADTLCENEAGCVTWTILGSDELAEFPGCWMRDRHVEVLIRVERDIQRMVKALVSDQCNWFTRLERSKGSLEASHG